MDERCRLREEAGSDALIDEFSQRRIEPVNVEQDDSYERTVSAQAKRSGMRRRLTLQMNTNLTPCRHFCDFLERAVTAW